MSRPLNVLWISLEDTSPRFGCYGDKVARTPNIDALAAQGTRFPNTFATSPVCSPSRLSVITGRYATELSGHHMRTTAYANYNRQVENAGRNPYCAVPPPHVKCFTETLRQAGYFCTNNGKTDYNLPTPMAAWDLTGKPEDLEDIHWRRRPDPEQPFFAVFNFERTHESQMWTEHGRAVQTDPASVEVPPFLPDCPEVREAIARQYDNIAYNDGRVGEVLAQLEADGLADSTVVFLWSDHGEGIPRRKRFVNEGGLHVPMIVRWPGTVAAGQTDTRLVSLIDLPATVLSVLGLPAPADYPGVPFVGPAQEEREHCFGHISRLDADYTHARAVRTPRFHYVRNAYAGREIYGYMPYRAKHDAMRAVRREQLRGGEGDNFSPLWAPEELYDVAADPHQMRNLAQDAGHRETLREMRALLDDWQLRHDPDAHTPESQIAERCWPGGEQPPTLPPTAILFTDDCLEGREVAPEETGPMSGPVLFQLHCLTEGATIVYRLAPDEPWRIYSRALRFEAGRHRLEYGAERYGFAASEIRTFELDLTNGA